MGVELGSTRIKATLIGDDFKPLASGSHGWENRLVDGIWTYDMDDVWSGIAACYSDLAADVKSSSTASSSRTRSSRVSGMMHGYVALDAEGKLLVPFRTWRNNITAQASEALTDLLAYPIAQRWTSRTSTRRSSTARTTSGSSRT